MSKVFKGVKRAFKKVVSGVTKVVKAAAKSPIFKTIAIAAAVYFTGGAALGAAGGLSSGAGALSGAMSGISSAWAGVTGAGSALMAGNLSGAASSLTGGLTGAFGKGAGVLANAATSLASGAPNAPTSLDAWQQQNDAKALLANSGSAAQSAAPGVPGVAPWGGAMQQAGAPLMGMPGGPPSGGSPQSPVNNQQQVKLPAAGNGLLSSVAPYAVYAAGQGLAGMATQKAEQEKAQKEYDRYNENMGTPLWADQKNYADKQYGNNQSNPIYNSRF